MPLCPLLHLRIRATAAAIACLTLGLLSIGVSFPAARAQTDVEAPVQRGQPITPQQRADLYRTLRKHAQILEAQAVVVKTVAKLVGPAVVHIEADVPPQASGLYGRRGQIEEAGSGVIIRLADKHYVLTNGHVVRNSSRKQIDINLADGRRIHPKRVWDDPATDVAVMEVSAPDLVTAELGDSDRMEIGDFVLAVGSPFGLSHSVTYGIISAKGRWDLQLGGASLRFKDFIQTDAAINPGNSGGPLVNLRGEVIGINTAIASNSGGNEGIGFAIPINMFLLISRQLIDRGKVSRAFMGVDLDGQFSPAEAAEAGLPRPVGARITGVRKGTPAEGAKLQKGDIVLQYNTVRVEDDDHLINLVGLTEVGKRVSLVVLRDRKRITVTLSVGESGKLKSR
ncbi:MAG: S1C family serine protease [Planctomycetota bacterium]|jgi:serine protease Do